MINFNIKSRNQLLMNSRLPEQEKFILKELQYEFESEFGPENYILIPSSGSSQKAGQSVKLIALKITSVLNSANRVNNYLKATDADNWGLVLPEFHVAGLGILARAYLLQSRVFRLDVKSPDFVLQIEKNKISFLSMVPAQIYDLVANQVKGPPNLKKVFVGGGFLNSELKKKVIELGWPVAEAYGMTETSSMIAVRENSEEWFKLMDNVDVKVENELLNIHCDSLLTAAIQQTEKRPSIKFYENLAWFSTDDHAEIKASQQHVYLKILGRKSDYVKILGEGVSLLELRSLLAFMMTELSLKHEQVELVSIEDERAENRLVLVFEEVLSEADRKKIVTLFNERCRPYEKVLSTFVLEKIPRTELGKLKTEELKSIIKKIIK
jgi:O-succinylbenzoic acid--CoA ligase